MAFISQAANRILVVPKNDDERARALRLTGANWRKDGCITLPQNLMSRALLEREFYGKHEWSAEVLEWMSEDDRIIAHGASVNDHSLEAWDMPDLWDTQAQAIDRLLRYGSAALFDDRGMGKTRTVLEAIRASQTHVERRAVVVTAKRLRETWRTSTELWWAADKVCVPTADTWSEAADQVGTATITVLTYDSLLNDDIHRAVVKLDPEWLVVDEAHNLKKRQTKGKESGRHTKSGALRSLPGRRRVALTGTPMPNVWHEVWALLNFVAPERFTSYWQFVEILGEVRESFWGGKDISPTVRDPELWDKIYDRWIISRDRPQHGKVWDFVPVELSAPEREAYNSMLKEWNVQKENGEELDAATHLARLTRLQQLAGGLGEWNTDVDDQGRRWSSYQHADPSAKVDTLLEMLGGLRRSVVFTRFRNRAEFVAKKLSESGIAEPLLITGGVGERVSQERLERFASDEDTPLVAVCVYGTISEGVNELVSAHDIFFLDWTTVKDVSQAADRLDRPGQTKQVRCVTLYARGTVDEAGIDREANKVVPLRKLLRSPDAWKLFEKI